MLKVPLRSEPKGSGAFRLLWAGETAGHFGVQVTAIVIPLFAIQTLGMGPRELGFLVTCEFLGFLLLGLPAGAWVDRVRRSRVLFVSSGIRAVFVLGIPCLSVLGLLSSYSLYAMTLGISICTVFFAVAYQTIVPQIVTADQLPASNAKLEASRSIAEVSGPAIAGFLMGWIGARLTMLSSAVSLIISTGVLSRIGDGSTGSQKPPRGSMIAQIRDGVAYVLKVPIFRAMAVRSSLYNLCNVATTTMFLLLLASSLKVSPGVIGVIYSAAGIGAVFGSALATYLNRRWTAGPVVLGSCVVSGVVSVALPLAYSGWPLIVSAAAYAVASCGIVISNITQISIRQSMCPTELLGRMNATMRFIVWGVIPLGASLAGVVAEEIGVRMTLAIAVAGEILSIIPMYFSPLRTVRLADAAAEASSAVAETVQDKAD